MKRLTAYALLVLLLLAGGNISAQVGDSFSNPIIVGTFDASFSYSDTKYTGDFTDQYAGNRPGTNDIFYKFTINTMMDVTIAHCGSESINMYAFLLDSSGKLISHTRYGCPTGNSSQAYIFKENLEAGTYYVVSEAFLLDKNIITQISGVVTVFPGNTRETAIDAGTHNSYFHYADGRNTELYSNSFQGQSTHDVFYKFTITTVMDITLLLCGSRIDDPYVYLLNSSGTVLASHSYTYGKCCCSYGGLPYLEVSDLSPGTYYVVSEGTNQNGDIYTEIIGKNTNLPGDTRETAINAGLYKSSFSYSDTKNTTYYRNQYPARISYDLFYKFSIGTEMDVTISHCGSEVSITYIYLLNESGELIDSNAGNAGCGKQSQLTKRLSSGTYYVVTEGAMGNITTQISGLQDEPAPPGDTRVDALNAGTHTTSFSYANTQNTTSFTNQYGRSSHDVFYKFTIGTPMDVTISHCGSGIANTYIYLLNEAGNQLGYNDDNSSGCGTQTQSYLTKANLPKGTYYVVSEGYSQNGTITTHISGIVPSIAGDTRANALDAGSYTTGFSYSNTQNTANFTNQYAGLSTNDVFYKFVITRSMNITISHCGSGVSNTYLHLLNASGNSIASNDNNTSGCTSNSAQAYLSMANLAPGTYYVVSEGYTNGNITTTVIGAENIQEPTDPVVTPPAVSLSTNQNYILTKTARIATTSSTSLTTANSMQTVQYFDGLGRPVETIHIAASPERKDLITYQEYDAFGRESKGWLPADYAGTCGSFRSLATIQSTTPATYGNDSRAFSEIRYENSPLNRIDKVYGPGQNWSTHPVTTGYATNTSSGDLSCTYYYLSGDNPIKSGNYAAGSLYVVQTTNEDGHLSYEFTDKLGHIVLQRQKNKGVNHDTYYVYDDFGNLRYVLPPLAADASNLADAVNKYGYVYKYDERNRCIEKKLPGAEIIYYVYDKADRLILSQDGVQRNASEWTFFKYDALGRLILSGVVVDKNNRQTLVNTYKNSLITESRGSAIMGYTNTSPLYVTASQVLQVNYYDDYSWVKQAALQQSGTPSGYTQPYSSAKGLLTGTMVRTLNPSVVDQYLITSFYYDYKGNLVGKHSENILSSYDHEYYAYNFAGEVEKKLLKHCDTRNSELLSEVYTYEYDHAGRMKKKYHAINGGTAKLMASYRYDNLGRLLTKNTAGLELTTFQYSIRGWLTGLSGQRFTESLSYSGQYGGNIASISWNVNNTGTQGYTFIYDHLGRMEQATYSGTGGRNYNESFTYDKHGNPLSITRYGRIQNGASFAYGLIDNLFISYYNGNRIFNISEAVSNQLNNDLMEFKKSTVSSPHYAYDVNGNMTKDASKNINYIAYNYLNLPKQVTFGDRKTITYVHDASGVKHEVRYYDPANPHISKTNYVSNKIYDDGSLSMILTEDGYLKKEGNVYHPFYYLKDHVGSNRVVIDGSSGGVVQVTNYYPFGMSFADDPQRNDQSIQRFKYTGQELDREHGLNLYDYHARMYDPAIGRFTTMDPLAEKYYSISPYAYVANNPVGYIDPTGMFIDDYFNENGIYLGTDNSESQKIRIMSQSTYDRLKVSMLNENGVINEEIGIANSILHSKSNITAEGSLAVYQHYNPTDLPLFELSTTKTSYNITALFKHDSKKAIGIGIDINGYRNSEVSDYISEIVNMFVHENKHYEDYKLGYNIYSTMDRKRKEQRAISTQMKDPTFREMRSEIQQGVINYGQRHYDMLFPLKTPSILNLLHK